MAILAENRHLRLKMMLRGPKLWVNLILNVIGVRLRFIGTQSEFLVFGFSIGPYGAMQKFWTPPPYRGVPEFVSINYYFNLMLVTPLMF